MAIKIARRHIVAARGGPACRRWSFAAVIGGGKIVRRWFAVLAVLVALGPSAAFAGPFPYCSRSINGHPLFATPPSVTSHFPNAPAVAYPGSLVLVVGQNFGPPTGVVIMNISKWNGTPMPTPLKIVSWSDTVIVANIPMITGVIAQSVSFEVKNICGMSNLPVCTPAPDAPCLPNPWQVQFVPTMDMQQIPAANVSCSMTSNNSGDSCMGGQPRFPSECLGLSSGAFPGLGVFDGIHNSGWGNGNHGTDSFTAKLQNTWTVEAVNNFNSSEVNGSNHTWANLSYSGSGANWSVPWSEDSCTALGYSGSVTITGPMGVPF